MEFRVLGPLEVIDDKGRTLGVTAPKHRALLAILLIAQNSVVSTDAIVDQLWGDRPPADASGALQAYISLLRDKLEPGRPRRGLSTVLVSKPPGYVLVVHPKCYDAAVFADELAAGQRLLNDGKADCSLERLDIALRLWRGPALVEFVFEGFAQAEAARLEELRAVALELRAEASLALGQHAALVPELEVLVRRYPLRERMWASLMVALYRAGRQSEALRAYGHCRRTLGDELGIEPGPALRQLESDILEQSPALSAPPSLAYGGLGNAGVTLSPPRAADTEREAPHNLPRPRSSLVGREDDLSRLETVLSSPGMVTLVGPGGVGKTRLAVEAGHRLRARYPDGVWLVELGPLAEPTLVPQALASVLGVEEQSGVPLTGTLQSALRSLKTLVILDNCEHLIDAAAALADTLLRHADELSVLATSREPLRIDGEVLWRASGLEVPLEGDAAAKAVAQYPSVRLFCDRAALRGPFALDAGNAGAVAALVRHLDGIPLALELAAARMSLGIDEVLSRLGDRFGVLTEGSRTAPRRHQTLRATVAWSYDALSEQERSLFDRLSVFLGTFSLKAAIRVCGCDDLAKADIGDLLWSLADKSLVMPEVDDGGTRYRLLETLRAYASEQLIASGKADRMHQRHLDWMVGAVENDWPALYGPRQVEVLAQLTRDHPNMRAALRWSLEAGQPEAGLRIARTLFRFWICGTRSLEGLNWLKATLEAAPSVDRRLRAEGLLVVAALSFELGLRLDNEVAAEEALALFTALGDRIGMADALIRGAPRLAGDWATTAARAREALATWEAAVAADPPARQRPGSEWVAARTHIIIGNALLRGVGDLFAARASFQRGLALVRATGDIQGITLALMGLGEVALDEGQHDHALVLLQEALGLAVQLNSTDATSRLLNLLGEVAVRQQRPSEAIELHHRALRLALGSSNRLQLSASLDCLAALANGQGEPACAARFASTARRLRAANHVELSGHDRQRHETAVKEAKAELGESGFIRAWIDAERMTIEQVVAHAVGVSSDSGRLERGKVHPFGAPQTSI